MGKNQGKVEHHDLHLTTKDSPIHMGRTIDMLQSKSMGILKWFDKLEDKIRARLARRPFIYGTVVGIGSVFFFRGIWLLADKIPILTGEVTIVLALIILGMTGTLSSHFVSDRIIASGLKKEKRWEETLKTETSTKEELALLAVEKELHKIREEIKKLSETK